MNDVLSCRKRAAFKGLAQVQDRTRPVELAHVRVAYAAPSPGARCTLDMSQWPRVVFNLRAAGAAATRRVAADQRAESVRDMKGL